MESKVEEALEKSSQLKHKNVAGIQLRTQELKQEVRQEHEAEFSRYVETHVDEPVWEVTEKFEKILEIEIQKIRETAALMIQTEYEKQKVRDSIIRERHETPK